jgi:L-ascorbate metabolism protein UlaG (beta-lactamase superfamily)
MQIQLIRNATLRVTYAGRLFLIDPFLAAKHTIESFAGISPNPLVDLPCSPEAVFENVEMVLVSHLHVDHFDPLAQNLLPKDIPIFCQLGDEERIMEKGFRQVTPIDDVITWERITIIRTPGRHGTGKWGEQMGRVSGFVFRADGEPTAYWCGDTIWYEQVERVIEDAQPDVIITHSSGAEFAKDDPIVMDAYQTIEVCKAAPQATVIAVHMESLDHGTVSRADLRARADHEGISDEQLLIPADGEMLSL